ncbi:conserved hypothetical protein [Bathymodiolus platifrons methanotrophic gill symbiont]|uniref:toxin n=1 Tax=Bathymodiolus platifrons methanotrophic gill symbiont TaxID=113268 RepID=UPI000B767B50|nr:toxin [Bathymodiolus platifrons methanotrophic gill symbiont]GAW86208.1 conserved hypothetical protein [Bathymodiolus platifrons methanotrophic gill symbiont]GFO77917.1 toxin [Bathymodiolus platifrons methanotrophic gill symbiont]
MKTKKIEWSHEKNTLLKQGRGICFEDVENAISDKRLLDILPHPNQEKYAHQKIFVIRIKDYIHYVPFVEDDENIFLKSIIPSRKLNNNY